MYNNLSVVMLQISSPLACGGPVAKLSVLDRVAKMRAVRDSFLNARFRLELGLNVRELYRFGDLHTRDAGMIGTARFGLSMALVLCSYLCVSQTRRFSGCSGLPSANIALKNGQTRARFGQLLVQCVHTRLLGCPVAQESRNSVDLCSRPCMALPLHMRLVRPSLNYLVVGCNV